MQSLSTRVVERVADHKSADPTELPPLQRAIDTDALDSLFAPGRGGGRYAEGVLHFAYAECRIVIEADPRSEPDIALIYADEE